MLLHLAAGRQCPLHGRFAELQLLKLQDTADKGLWSCYESFERSLADLYADFSWDGREARQIEPLLADARLSRIAAAIKAAHSFDLEAELRQVLKESGASSYEQVKGRLGASSYLALLDAGQLTPARWARAP